MAITQAQYDAYFEAAVEAFIARKGASTVTIDGESVSFESWDKLKVFFADLRGQISDSTATRTRYVATSKGV